MDFELNETQRGIQLGARDFAQGEFRKEITLELELNHQFPWEIWKKSCQLGFVGVHYPEQYGGQGLG